MIFGVLVPVYFAVLNGLPDGLDKLLEQNHIPEKESIYSSPFSQLTDYGTNVSSYLVNGIIGGIVTFFVGVILVLLIKKHQ